MSESQRGGRKPRSYYVDYSKRDGRFSRGGGRGNGRGGFTTNHTKFPGISLGQRGFLITSIDEVKSYLEMRNIFEGYFEQLYQSKQENDDKRAGDDKKEMTTEEELESELKQLRTVRPFRQVKTNCHNSIFITINNDYPQVDPIIMVDKFFQEMEEKKEIKTRNTFKVLPILDTFRNSSAAAKEAVTNLLQTIYKDDIEPRKFFIELQSRGNYKLDSDDKQKMIEEVADTVTKLRTNWTVSREEADYIIVLVALREVCCITFLKNYFKRSKYNVTEFCKDFAQLPESSEGATDKMGEKVDDEVEKTSQSAQD